MALVRPVSSSSERKTTPLAVGGCYATTGRPAVVTVIPSRTSASTTLGRISAQVSAARCVASGWAVSGRPVA
jgi:hypothetical protein